MDRFYLDEDRFVVGCLRLASALPLLLLAALIAGLLIALPASAASCKGRDLLAELKSADPDKIAAIRKQADATLNGKGLLWKVQADGGSPSWLFGTIHMSDPRVVALPDAARKAFSDARTLVIETTDVLDEKTMAASMFKHPELMMFSGSETLEDHFSPDQREAVATALQDKGVPFASIRKMKPWMLISMVASPACEAERKAQGMPVLDVKLAADAAAQGKAVEGLETAVEQLQAMASLPMELHIRGLVETLALGDRLDDIIETMIVLYEKGETGMFWPLVRQAIPQGQDDAFDYSAFDRAMVRARNHTMAERAEKHFEAGGAFVAVGALHLPGEEGLVALLRDKGYTVKRVD